MHRFFPWWTFTIFLLHVQNYFECPTFRTFSKRAFDSLKKKSKFFEPFSEAYLLSLSKGNFLECRTTRPPMALLSALFRHLAWFYVVLRCFFLIFNFKRDFSIIPRMIFENFRQYSYLALVKLVFKTILDLLLFNLLALIFMEKYRV